MWLNDTSTKHVTRKLVFYTTDALSVRLSPLD